jgi:hypothetical protein
MNLNPITIPSINLEISLPFYQKLRHTLNIDAWPLYLRFACPEGESTFFIHRVDELPKGEGI